MTKKLTKTEQYYTELKRIINEEITFKNYNPDTVKDTLNKTIEWSDNQTILKRTPKKLESTVFYIITETFIEKFLQTNLQYKFKNVKEVEDYIWERFSPTGWSNVIAGYDTTWIQIMKQYKPKLMEWWGKEHQNEQLLIEAIALYSKLDSFHLFHPQVKQIVDEFKDKLKTIVKEVEI